MRAEREQRLKGVREQQHSAKKDIWELKNQVLDLKETIRKELKECLRLSNELEISDSEDLVSA